MNLIGLVSIIVCMKLMVSLKVNGVVVEVIGQLLGPWMLILLAATLRGFSARQAAKSAEIQIMIFIIYLVFKKFLNDYIRSE